ncbi:flavin reductase family protein [Streptomyces sp. SCSIO 75703]|uniref:flavin reductase family protein n=1 Tax=unclassified Streptomyces TaxID=2593676 RepID=UPI0004C0EC2D|nr:MULTISPECIES: flavin reductase family protein [unclassified Streptomyces]
MTIPEADVRSTTAPPVPKDRFRAAMGAAATGVTVVATGGPLGRFAQTVSAMCSVSEEPPTLLVCVNRRSPLNEAIRAHGTFAVSVLGRQHDHVADTFAGRPWPGKERWDFTCGEWTHAPSGAPRLADAVASFDCAVDTRLTVGTHHIYVGLIHEVTADGGTPLVYSDRRYARPEAVAPSTFPAFPGAGPAHRDQQRMPR